MKSCTRCLYDENIPYIEFNEVGVCNYCLEYDKLCKLYPNDITGEKALAKLIEKIKRENCRNKYDVIIGLSGGCDSSYLLYRAKEMGLRILAVHYDNHYDMPIAKENIKKMVTALNIDLETYSPDKAESDDIIRSALKASIPETDGATDLALVVSLYHAASRYNIKYILDGHSFRTEGISPQGWSYMDAKYIQSVQRKFGTYEIKTVPLLWMHKQLFWMIIKRIKRIRLLYYLNYDKSYAKKYLHEQFGWEWYGGHHLENMSAYFYNNYYAPIKFGFDGRYVELASLVRSGQMSREDAVNEMKKPLYYDERLINEFITSIGLTENEFESYMKLPKKTYKDYKTYKKDFERYKWFFWLLANFNMVPMSFYIKFTKKYD